MIEIIPAIDIIEGKCVRLTQGDYTQKKVYSGFPLEIAKQFEGAGIRRLHLVDLDGAKKGEVVNLKVLENIAAGTKLTIDFGGGIKSEEAVNSAFSAGASIITIGSLAIKNPGLFYSWINKYGGEKILLGADVKSENIAINGWTQETNVNIFDFLRTNLEKGIKTIFCTDVSKDGLLQGPSLELYKEIIRQNKDLNLIASGGVSSVNDIYELNKIGCKGVILGKAIYEGFIPLDSLSQFLKSIPNSSTVNPTSSI
jgi:phosphoribosylformimino-5-aminoimidazole carboxamide ribotide isomerase